MKEFRKNVEYTLQQIHNHLIFFKGDKYPELKNNYAYVTASLLEGDDIKIGILTGGKWITISENMNDGLLINEIELCDDEDFPKEIEYFNNLMKSIYNKIPLTVKNLSNQ